MRKAEWIPVGVSRMKRYTLNRFFAWWRWLSRSILEKRG